MIDNQTPVCMSIYFHIGSVLNGWAYYCIQGFRAKCASEVVSGWK